MAIQYGFFDSADGDRLYSAADLTDYFLRLIPSGVIEGGFEVTASGLDVSVSAGWGFLRARWVELTAPETLTAAACTTGGVRYDRVILRLDLSQAARNITLSLRQGTDSQAPAPIRAGNIYELSLARLIVGAEGVVQTIDERGDNSVCGYVRGFGALGGMSFERLTRAQYDGMESHAANTMYIVGEEDGTISIYIGDVQAGGGGGDFTIFEVVDGTAKSLTSSAAHYLYNPDKEITSATQEVFSIFTQTKLGLYIIGFDERYANVSAGLAFQGYDYFDVYTATGQWFKTVKSGPYQRWYPQAEEKILYNLTAFEDYHPALTGYLATETEIPINTVNEYTIGEVFDTGLKATDNIVIVDFSGEIYIYRYSSALPTASLSGTTYSFSAVSGVSRTPNLRGYLSSKQLTKSAFSYESRTGSYTVDTNANEAIIAATCDIKDSGGTVLFSKNADIGDYI